jgi:hypothetical protein
MGENENKTPSLREAIAAGWDAAVAEEAPAVEEAPVAEEVQEEAVTEVPVQETVQEPVQTPVQEPVQTPAENPANGQMAQLMEIIRQQQEMIGQLTAQASQAGQALQQQSALAEEAVNSTMEPEPYPQFDFNAIRYLNAEEQNQAMAQWQNALMERMVADAAARAMEQMAPIREQYEANRRIAEDDAARTAVFGDARFADFADRRESIERVISATPALQGMAPMDKWMLGGLVDRGMRHANPPGAEEILAMARANPDVMKALAAQQATEAAQAQAGVPKIAASAGMTQAQAIPENRPKNVKELGAALRKGLR